ncbi:MAG: flagellar M-ring protein FliF [Burkholderiales bacterium]|nr:flagellar M-ring protein FliF [Burkholderiales bacterium]
MAAGTREFPSVAGVLAQLFTPQRLALLTAIAAAAAAVTGVWLWTRTPDYRVLYANLPDREGGAVVAALQQMNVPYQLSDGAILVPGSMVHDARLRLAGQGLPKGGGTGFELLENPRLGTSQFLEQVNYQRALEGELARSIQTLSAVRSARVHLALARPTAFLREQPKSSASVVLALAPGRTLEPAQVNAIVNLVANSVPELPAQRVTVLDQGGNLLSARAGAESPQGLDAGQLAYVREIEAGYVKRIETILAPIVGSANIRAQVTADLDFSRVERAEELYKPNHDPANVAMRSQSSSESQAPGGAQAGGVPGALSNQPPAPASAPIVNPAAGAAAKGAPPATASVAAGAGAASATHSRKDSTINYEVDRTVRHVSQPVGTLKRLSAAVVVNYRKEAAAEKEGGKGEAKAGAKPLPEEEMKQITALVREAIGFTEARGDTLNVVNRPFNVPEVEPVPETPLWKDPQVIEMAKSAGRNLLFAAVAFLLFVRVIRPMFRRLAEPPPAPALPDESGDARNPGPRTYEANLQLARQVAQQEPQRVASVVKSWVGGNE